MKNQNVLKGWINTTIYSLTTHNRCDQNIIIVVEILMKNNPFIFYKQTLVKNDEG